LLALQKEYDARFVVKRFRDLGAMSALPVVIAKKTPLQFRHWQPGFGMTSCVYGIPVPEDSAVVTPDAMLVPMVAFDNAGFRLGYGGGYFDITLAGISPPPLAIGVCYEMFRVETLDPQPHDIAMDFVVTARHLRGKGGKTRTAERRGKHGAIRRAGETARPAAHAKYRASLLMARILGGARFTQ
jgi:5,10-methenyltetrahydrofolate synthetase